ncbi:hypothetical protein M2306_002618 [Myroides gitamensis]|nr:hypothetical protein [Myroides odoratus]MDH6601924.1 hypothetical protein [Myroides gitamensis]
MNIEDMQALYGKARKAIEDWLENEENQKK